MDGVLMKCCRNEMIGERFKRGGAQAAFVPTERRKIKREIE